MIEGRVVPLVPPASAASGGSNDSIDKLFDDGNDVEPEHPTVGDEDVLAKTIAKDVLEVVVEKTKKSKRKRKMTGVASVSTYPPKKLREDYHAATSNIGRKSLATIHSLISKDSSVLSEVAKPRDDGPIDSVFGLNLRTRLPSMRYVVSSDDSYHSDSHSEVNSFAGSPIADALIMTVAVTTIIAADVSVVSVSKDRVRSKNLENFRDFASADLDSKTLNCIYVPKWKVTNDSVLDDPYVYRDLTNLLAPPALFSQLRAMDYDQLYTEFNKDKLEDKCAEKAALLSEKDVDIVDLKSLLSLKEAEAAEPIRLRGQLSIVEAADAAKGNELKGLKEKNLALEEEKSVLSEKVMTLESVTTAKETELASLSSQVAKLTFDLSGFQLSRDELSSKVASLEFKKDSLADQSFEYLHVLGEAIGCAINKAMQDGLKAWIDHGKARRDLSVIKAYDPSIEANYVDAVNALRTVDFPLLFVVRGEIMEKRLSLIDVMVPFAESLSLKSLIGEASTSAISTTARPVTTLFTTFASIGVVPSLSISDYQVLDVKPHDEDPLAITFEEEELDTTLEMFPLRSLSLYAPLPNASVTSYGPSHLVLKVGMPISTGITASVPYVSENGVSLLLDLIIVRCAHKTCEISSIQFLLLSSNHALIPSPKLLLALSTKPLA
ncbi:hypothetical protein Tco_0727776 [Tanacetum coccineum]|uniref:Transposase (Putative), gypsy type n=1 Tax=Tanacetum coccineum TaxID=301880 RepID=A0ABQ4YJW3_9ASTR